MFLLPMRYQIGKKSDIIILSVELLYGKKFLKDEVFAKKYAEERLQKIIGKKADEVFFHGNEAVENKHSTVIRWI